MKKVICDYCGRSAEYVDSKAVYGSSHGMIYLCRPCNAYVGVHKGTDQPKGRLANAELREYKKKAHSAFDPLWRYGGMTRRQAYQWLSGQMRIPEPEAHIGMFDVARCIRAIEVCKAYTGRA